MQRYKQEEGPKSEVAKRVTCALHGDDEHTTGDLELSACRFTASHPRALRNT